MADRAAFKGEYMSNKADVCPFCGQAPILVPWHGGGPRKRMVMCIDDGCDVQPEVSGSTEAVALRRWNRRQA